MKKLVLLMFVGILYACVSTKSTPVQTASSEPSRQAYRIGDTGPAGGLIFYDKGNNSGGWRYLEAAPVEAEFRARWSVGDVQVQNTQTTVGSGRRNTQLIVEQFRQTSGEWDSAAQKCDELEFNGFDDWFLPSRDELDQMYGNLKRRNLGDFKDGGGYDVFYWASSMQENNIISPRPHRQYFRNGEMGYAASANNAYVRPIRQVVGP
jgi:hypothetical protein